MGIEEWWPKLSDSAQAWLIDNNGDLVPSSVLDEIVSAGGVLEASAKWVGEIKPDGFLLSDEATDWIESVANDEI